MNSYKVVRVTKTGKRVSAVVKHRQIILTYRKGKPTTAKVGGCLVFSLLKEALRFADLEATAYRRMEVWKARGTANVPLGAFCNASMPWWHGNTFDITQIAYAWHTIPLKSRDWPTETKAYKTVTLVERVYATRSRK